MAEKYTAHYRTLQRWEYINSIIIDVKGSSTLLLLLKVTMQTKPFNCCNVKTELMKQIQIHVIKKVFIATLTL